MPITWFKDASAKASFDAFKHAIGPIIARLLPSFRLTHIGFRRMDDTKRFVENRDEIQIVLHLRPLGEAWVISERLRASAQPEAIALSHQPKEQS